MERSLELKGLIQTPATGLGQENSSPYLGLSFFLMYKTMHDAFRVDDLMWYVF